jgi:hypothetical protein
MKTKLLFLLLLASATCFAQVNLNTQVRASCPTATGSTNAYAVVISKSSPYSQFCFKANASNTGAATVAINGGSATPIKKHGSTALAAGDITSGQIVWLISDGTNYQLQSWSGVATSGTVTGPGSSTAHDLAGFADTSGSVLEDTAIAKGDVLHAVSPALGYAHFPGSSQVPTSVTLPRAISFDIACSGGLVTTSLDLCATSGYITVPFGCTISAYNLTVDAGTITVKFWKIATGTAIPTSSNSISTSGVSISSGTAIHSTTTSDFTTTTVAANDIMAMAVTAVATAKEVTGVLQCDESQ